jgi:hypothetical protein
VAETETVETEQTPKKGGRKPDPMTQLINELKAEIKNLGEVHVGDYPTHTRRHYADRGRAWGREYGREGGTDKLVMSHAYGALGHFVEDRRQALIQLAAAALVAAERLDDDK